MNTEEQAKPSDQEPQAGNAPSPDTQFIKVNLLNAEDCPVIYANYATVTATPVDIQIVFAHFGDLAQSGQEINAKATVRIAMAPEHALLLMQIINNNLKAYVKTHGPLRNLPSRIQDVTPPSQPGTSEAPPKSNLSQP